MRMHMAKYCLNMEVEMNKHRLGKLIPWRCWLKTKNPYGQMNWCSPVDQRKSLTLTEREIEKWSSKNEISQEVKTKNKESWVKEDRENIHNHIKKDYWECTDDLTLHICWAKLLKWGIVQDALIINICLISFHNFKMYLKVLGTSKQGPKSVTSTNRNILIMGMESKICQPQARGERK